jgi:AcrR family transcriptional regulator
MFEAIENHFAATGRTPKGQRTLRAIFRATRTAVTRHGIQELSLDGIASDAGLTQAALRYYFPTRDDLLTAFFVRATEWFQHRLAALLEDHAQSPRARLEACLTWHLEYMEEVDTIVWLEASAYWLRRDAGRRVRDEWYRWLVAQYAALIAEMQPSLRESERRRRAYAVLTLVLGAWVTHGRGSAVAPDIQGEARRHLLVDAALDIALGSG